VEQAQLLCERFDRIFKRASTGYTMLDRCSGGCFATKEGSCAFSNAQKFRQHKASENDIRAFSTKEKSPAGPSATWVRPRDIMLWLYKTCMKLKLSFHEFIGARLGIQAKKSRPRKPHPASPA